MVQSHTVVVTLVLQSDPEENNLARCCVVDDLPALRKVDLHYSNYSGTATKMSYISAVDCWAVLAKQSSDVCTGFQCEPENRHSGSEGNFCGVLSSSQDIEMKYELECDGLVQSFVVDDGVGYDSDVENAHAD